MRRGAFVSSFGRIRKSCRSLGEWCRVFDNVKLAPTYRPCQKNATSSNPFSQYFSLTRPELFLIVTSQHVKTNTNSNIIVTIAITSRYPLTIVSGKGCKLFDSTGKEYLDFFAEIATCILGYSNAELSAAVTPQINTVHHVSNLYYIPAQAELAVWLVANSCADKASFCNSVAEANEGTIKLVRRYASMTSGRGIADPIIITAKKIFQWRTLAELSATG